MHGPEDIEGFNINVNDFNRTIVIRRMELEYSKIVNILKGLKKSNLIRSIFIPKNKKIQKQLDALVVTKKEIKRSVRKIRDAFD